MAEVLAKIKKEFRISKFRRRIFMLQRKTTNNLYVGNTDETGHHTAKSVAMRMAVITPPSPPETNIWVCAETNGYYVSMYKNDEGNEGNEGMKS